VAGHSHCVAAHSYVCVRVGLRWQRSCCLVRLVAMNLAPISLAIFLTAIRPCKYNFSAASSTNDPGPILCSCNLHWTSRMCPLAPYPSYGIRISRCSYCSGIGLMSMVVIDRMMCAPAIDYLQLQPRSSTSVQQGNECDVFVRFVQSDKKCHVGLVLIVWSANLSDSHRKFTPRIGLFCITILRSHSNTWSFFGRLRTCMQLK
jgi:hypothetical protein